MPNPNFGKSGKRNTGSRAGRGKKPKPQKVRSVFVNDLASRVDLKTTSVSKLLWHLNVPEHPEAIAMGEKIRSGELTLLSAEDAAVMMPMDRGQMSAWASACKGKTARDMPQRLRVPHAENSPKRSMFIDAGRFRTEVVERHKGRIDVPHATAILRLRYGLGPSRAKAVMADPASVMADPAMFSGFKPSISPSQSISLQDFGRVLHEYDRRYGRGGRSVANILKGFRMSGGRDINKMPYDLFEERALAHLDTGRFSLRVRTMNQISSGDLRERLSKATPEVKRNTKSMLDFLGMKPNSSEREVIGGYVTRDVLREVGSAVTRLVKSGEMRLEFKARRDEEMPDTLNKIEEELRERVRGMWREGNQEDLARRLEIVANTIGFAADERREELGRKNGMANGER
jgi:predicted house-cleaning noncanonical NTP pyrophosphatase (MazG superfamily)